MNLQAVFFAPFRFAAGSLKIVALFRFDDTTVTLCQGLKARITEALTETFAGFAAAGDTINFTEKRQGDGTPDKGIQRYHVIPDWELVLDGLFQGCDEFLYVA
jgi:hypothetical protein